MSQGPGAERAPDESAGGERGPGQDVLAGLGERRELLVWVGEHLPQVRRSIVGQRLLYWSLGIGFVIGLAAHVGGYLLKSVATTGPFGLLVDLLYGLGLALWTGLVVVVFVEIVPEAKRRHYKQALDAYEAAQREQAQAGRDQVPGDDQAPPAR